MSNGRASTRWIQFDDTPSTFEAFIAGGDATPPVVDVDPMQPVLVIYTSAFEGRPNGAMLTHTGLLLQCLLFSMVNRIDNQDRTLGNGPMFHLGVFLFVLSTMVMGGTVVLTRTSSDLGEICRVIAAERCSRGYVMPVTARKIVEMNADGRYDLSSFRSFIPIPEWMAMVRPDDSPWGRAPVGFGQTETTGLVALAAFGAEPGESAVGRVVPGAEVRVVDTNDHDVPGGEIGEIVVRGPLVSAGYWNRDELNAQRTRSGWWHTNDLGRMDDSGRLVFVGPKTQMIKSGMENIYPAEVEVCIESHPAVKEAALIGIPDERWVQAAKAIVVLNDGMTATADEIVEHCRERIASYKKPRYVEFVPGPLPRLGPAKDYAALDAQHGGGNYAGRGTSELSVRPGTGDFVGAQDER
jgi:long-chain acyl-CoA synthetase